MNVHGFVERQSHVKLINHFLIVLMGPVRWKIKEHVVRSPRLPNDLESEM